MNEGLRGIGRRASRLALALALAGGTALPLAHAQTGDSRLTGLKLSGDEPIQIESDALEVREEEGIAVFSGNVAVAQGQTVLKSGRLVVHYARDSGSATTGTSSIERLEADGKVYVRSEDQVATGDRGTFDMESEVLVLSGEEVVLSEGDNVIVGCRLVVQMRSGQARLEGCGEGAQTGRVKMLLKPGSVER
ncbi:LPS ABC transporter substrate-binding protein LptA [Aquibium sp. A9E412]|uniref:LptA/OstA family protein n=1 Tax=Aquibium sp. A9E412 TaxID=2976767 RepID=UPI0025B03CFE|nr:LptA/OstA family protein [Aquibium sp. A9E412]MDN2568141.1 LPS ABC transporter substrate-binding protein LptA [Aquibium sp. A9E412]